MSDDINVLIYHGDDFDEWNSENNPYHLPVVQLQSVPGQPGGWVLRRPNSDEPAEEWLRVPLCAGNQDDAVIEAKDGLRKHYEDRPDARPKKTN